MNQNLELPESWKRVKLIDISQIFMGQSPKASEINSEGKGLPFFQGKTEFTDVYPIINKHCEQPSRIAEQNDILLSVRAPVGPVNLASEKSGFGRGLCAIRAFSGVSFKYLFYQLKGLENYIASFGTGSTFAGINRDKVESLSINIAPEKEQQRIVEKLDELLSELDFGVQELKTAQVKLKHYRQSLLKSAVEGALTQKWRDDNKHQIEETGKELLNRILIERKQRWVQNKLEEFKEKGKNPPKNWQDKYPEPIQPDTTDLPELPEGWVWATIDQLAINKRYGSSSKTNDDASGVPVLRMGNIQDGKLDYDNLKYLPEGHKEFPELLLNDGDLLFNRTNSAELVGKTAVYKDIGKPVSYASYLISVTFSEHFLPEIAAHYINSVLGKKWIAEVMNQTAGQANVNGTKLGALAIPLPSISEQKVLIEEVSNEFESIDLQIKATALGLKQSEAQRKNILKLAFSGKLVPQDENDEPAPLLLEKISNEREELASKVKPKKTRQPKKKAKVMDTLLEVLTAEDKWIDAQEAFEKCGVTKNTTSDDIEKLYLELRELLNSNQVEVKKVDKKDKLRIVRNEAS